MENIHSDSTITATELEIHFPRVAQTITEKWGESDLEQFFWSLLTDTRGDRHGFPEDVLTDVEFLKELHNNVYPKTAPAYSTYPWQGVLDR